MGAYEFLSGKDVIVEIAPGVDRFFQHVVWPWIDITDDVRVGDRITISAGRDNEASQVDAATCNLVLDNRSGDYCRTNPLGAYYGTLGRNTPLRVRVRPVRDAFGRTTSSGWGTADSGQAWTTAGGSGTDYATAGGAATMLLGSVNVSRRATLTTVDIADGDIYAVFSASAVATGAALRAAVVLRAGADPSADHYRAQVNFETGGTLTVSVVERAAGTDTTLDTQSVSGAYSAGTQVAVRAILNGSSIIVRCWRVADGEPDDTTASSADTTLTTGAIGVRCLAATGNTNVSPVISTHAFQATLERFVGDVPEWAPRWDKSAVDQRVSIQAAGILRRLQQGAAPLKSSSFRYITANNPSAYWALEDGENATQGASGVQGQPPLRLTSGSSQGFSAGLAGSAGQPELLSLAGHSGVLSADISGVSSSRWTLEFAYHVPPSTSGQIRRPISWFTTGTYSRWDIEVTAAGDANLYATSSAGRSLIGSWGAVDGFTSLDLIAVEADQNGGTLDITLWLGGGFDMDDAAPTATLGAIYRVMLNPYGDNLDDSLTVGHLAIYSDDSVDADTSLALYGFSGDGTYERVTRLCTEEGIQLDANLGTAQFMGEQGTKTLVEMLREAEAAEQGLLFESGAGLVFRRLPELYNRPEGLTLERTLGHLSEPPEPTDDDQRLRNDVKVTREGGSSARYESENPAYLPSVVGRYDEELTLNLAFDTVLQQFAEWRVWLGTQDDLRWPRITFDMASRPALIEPWLRRRIGDRCTINDPPDGVPPTALELIIEGYSETIGEAEWNVTLNCSPMRPYEIATIEGAGGYEEPVFILDHASSTLDTSIDSDDTSLSIAVTGGTLWSTVDEPYDIDIGGEQMTVTACTGGSSPQTFTVTRSVNGIVKSHSSGATVTLWRPAVLGL